MIKTTRSILVGTVLTVATVSTVVAAEKITVSHGYPPVHDIVAKGIEPWMACVREKAGSTVSFNYYPSGQIASAKDSLDAVNGGLAHVSTAPIGYVTDKMPLSGLAMLPNMGESSVEGVNAFRKLLDTDSPIAKEFANNRVKPIFVNVLPPYQIVSGIGPITTLPEFRGKVLRSAGGTMNLVINRLQGSPAEMNGGDMYVAMQRGTLDASILSLASVKPYSMEELVTAISSNANFGTFPTILVMDARKFDSLDDKTQEVVISCGREVERSLAEYLDVQSQELRQEFTDSGITIYEFAEKDLSEISKQMEKVALNYIKRLERRGLPAGEVYQAYQDNLNN